MHLRLIVIITDILILGGLIALFGLPFFQLTALAGLWLFFYYSTRLYDLEMLRARSILRENLVKAGIINLLAAGIFALISDIPSSALISVWGLGWIFSWGMREIAASWGKRALAKFQPQVKLPLSGSAGQKDLLKKIKTKDRAFYLALKRVLDLAVAIFVGILFSPLALLAGLLIKLEDRGPIFFKKTRLGLKRKPFLMIKFRTMTPEASFQAPQIKLTREKDSRITKIGRILRKTHLDEYPQLWNVLRGEMSFVGPRPELPEIAQKIEKIEPLYRLRYLAKPGMTGWVPLNYFYAYTMEDKIKGLEYDLYYLTHRSLTFDLSITLKTPSFMLGTQGR